ncbi:hypothetical protein SPBRAN_1114 [uncultured Candidatus Thioglobus sp.]|nr:hypothetical protein SPBRAN_1114 [uncultured Candidatus Thioglobus sp.]
MDGSPSPKRFCIEEQGGMELEERNTQGGVAAGQQQKCMSVGYGHYIQNAFSSPLC